MAARSERREHGETTLNAMSANAMPLVDPTSKTRIDDRNIMDRKIGVFIFLSAIFLSLTCSPTFAAEGGEELPVGRLGNEPRSFTSEADTSGGFTWWFPEKADALILPISAGMQVETTNGPLMRWLKEGSPWDLSKLPIIGVRYGARTAVGIVPWPHYAELVVEQRVGVRFKFPPGRSNATPCEVVAMWRGTDPLEVARAFRDCRASAKETGAIPKPRPLSKKAAELLAVKQLFGAPNIYLWGPALFSRHDVDKGKWIAFARALRDAGPDTIGGRSVARSSTAQRGSLTNLAKSEWPEQWLTLDVAAAIEGALTERTMLHLPENTPLIEVVRKNSKALAEAFPSLVHDPATWGDGFSPPMLESLRAAGIDRALLLLSDLYGQSPRPDVAAKAAGLGYLTGPYDSYHSVHNPKAAPDATWETAQFDQAAFAQGRVQNADGSGHGGFKNRSYHFSPAAAWPYVRSRVNRVQDQTPYSAWFVDCDATGEWFDDYSRLHSATRVDDMNTRRQRLRWLETEKKLVVGSEEGSALFADVIAFGHGIQTAYLGHLAPEFRNPQSPSFLGRQWPSDTPVNSFKTIPVPSSLLTPYFDPRVRIPLYQAALGDELVVSHHWSLDPFKLSDVAGKRELMELLYMVPPMYHLNREIWPERQQRIVRHFKFWSPLHRQLAIASLTRFETLTPDRLLQRTTFRLAEGEATITVNFGNNEAKGFPPESATVKGAIEIQQPVYRIHGP